MVFYCHPHNVMVHPSLSPAAMRLGQEAWVGLLQGKKTELPMVERGLLIHARIPVPKNKDQDFTA